MAGYIMTLDNLDSLEDCILTGTYSTYLSEPKNNLWSIHHEGTFADYFSMKENDNIYFFIKRKIYGIGRIVNLNKDCKFLNFIEADIPTVPTKEKYQDMEPLLPDACANYRCFCTFEPSPYFFSNGVDMDDVLNSNPSRFRMLRAMWKVSFIKVDDEENQALQDIILKRNEEFIFNGHNTFKHTKKIHNDINRKISFNHRMRAYNILRTCAKDNTIKHEMAIEAALCRLLIKDNYTPFGKWDYISHQVVASPFKAIDYMDKMDVFGYRYIEGFLTRSKYLVIEIKKDAASTEVIDQIMKYVDWIQEEYAYGDYSMIEAFIVAADFPPEVIEKCNLECVRKFTKGYRPTLSCTWNNIKLIKYTYDIRNGNRNLHFEIINK